MKKGQAAMEFLMTYGWAIMVAIIVVGVLGYYGVFSPGKYITGSAILNPPFYMNAWSVVSDADTITPGDQSEVNIEIKNNGGSNYDVRSVAVVGCGLNDTQTTILTGKTQAFNIPCTSPLVNGENFKGDVTVVYTKSGSSIESTSTGTIAEKIA
ncbi:hypothetical protein KW805_01740 [Candidatus Pacearchaeota archaeon]|nr:hypothetical protein [Candidatus Pacearchaeota archaeon]